MIADQRFWGASAHLLEVQAAILVVVPSDGAALIQHHIVPQRDQLKVTHVQGVNVAPLPNASTLRSELSFSELQNLLIWHRLASCLGQNVDKVLAIQSQPSSTLADHEKQAGLAYVHASCCAQSGSMEGPSRRSPSP